MVDQLNKNTGLLLSKSMVMGVMIEPNTRVMLLKRTITIE
jgi:hypothetical protein